MVESTQPPLPLYATSLPRRSCSPLTSPVPKNQKTRRVFLFHFAERELPGDETGLWLARWIRDTSVLRLDSCREYDAALVEGIDLRDARAMHGWCSPIDRGTM